MTLPLEDHLAITELISLHGHLVDAGELERFEEVFTSSAGPVQGVGHYHDVVVRGGTGWRVSHRKVSPRRVPLNGTSRP